MYLPTLFFTLSRYACRVRMSYYLSGFSWNRKEPILMQTQVIVPLDGSASAEAILPHALLFAQREQSILTLLQVVVPSDLPGVSDQMFPDTWSEGEEIWGETI
jgi:hypothetical protein